ncbi:reverse transcriptase, partial [Elysia marginata]
EERELEDRREKERREHEIRVLTLKEAANHSSNASGGGAAAEKPSKKPHFPMFNSLVQDIDVYLENFSRHATAAKWPVSEWPSLLFNLLQGDALAVLLSLSDADRDNYEK